MWRRRAQSAAEVALDLGTSRVRVVVRGRGVVLDEPSVVVLDESASGRSVRAVGAEAAAMAPREGTRRVQPLRGGAVEDWPAFEHLVRWALERAGASPGAEVLVASHGDASETERRALDAALRAAGVGRLRRVDSLLAGALGAQLPVTTAAGSMVLSVGAGRTQAGVITAHGVATRRSVAVAGDAMDAAIVHWLRRLHHVVLPPLGATRLKLDIGCAQLPPTPLRTRIVARDLGTGQAVTLDVDASQTMEALKETVQRVVTTAVEVLRETSPDLCADVLERGLVLVGGSARLRGLDSTLRDALSVPCLLADEPELAVARGLLRLLEEPALLLLVEDEPAP